MANDLYARGATRLLTKDIDWVTDDMRIVAVKSTYTPNLATDEFASVLGANTLGTAMTIPGRSTVDGGIAQATLTSYAGVLAGDTVTGWVIYQWSGALASSPLLAWIDTNDDGTPISRAGDGANIPIIWPSSLVFQI